MRYPNQRYGDIDHFNYYMQGRKIKDVAKQLKRDERTIRNWLSGAQKIPWWVPELMRLQRIETYNSLKYMGLKPRLAKLGLVGGQVVDFPEQMAIRGRLEKLDAPHPIQVNNTRIIKELKVAAG